MASRGTKVSMGSVENTVLHMAARAIGRSVDSGALIKGLLDAIHPTAFVVCKTMGELGMQGNSRVMLAYRNGGTPLHVTVRAPDGVVLPNVGDGWFEVRMDGGFVSEDMERMRRVVCEALGGMGELPILCISFLNISRYMTTSDYGVDVMYGMFPELVGLFPAHAFGKPSTIALSIDIRQDVYNTRKLLQLLTAFKATIDSIDRTYIDVHVSLTTRAIDFGVMRDAFERLSRYV